MRGLCRDLLAPVDSHDAGPRLSTTVSLLSSPPPPPLSVQNKPYPEILDCPCLAAAMVVEINGIAATLCLHGVPPPFMCKVL